MSIKTIVNELHVCDICGKHLTLEEDGGWASTHLCYSVKNVCRAVYREHRTFDFCEDCELLLTEAIINGKMKTHLRGR